LTTKIKQNGARYSSSGKYCPITFDFDRLVWRVNKSKKIKDNIILNLQVSVVTPQKRCVFQKKSTHAIYPKGITCFFPRQKKTYDQINRLAKETVFRCKKSNGKKNGQQCNQKKKLRKTIRFKKFGSPRNKIFLSHTLAREPPLQKNQTSQKRPFRSASEAVRHAP